MCLYMKLTVVGYYHIFVFIPVVQENEQLQIYKVIYTCYLNKYYCNDNKC